jgi:glycerophosphoryl diester phosphodiesterase
VKGIPPMKKKAKKFGLSVALVIFVFSFVNASWLAPIPKGKPQIFAHRGVYHLYDKRAAAGRDTCTAQFIYPPKHAIFENTIASIREAATRGADIIEIDVAPTKDGRMVLFHDWTVDCRTNGKGEVRDLTLAELKALDIGFGYTSDGAKTFPLRGKGTGQIPTVEEVLKAFPAQPLLFNFKSKQAEEADQLVSIIKASSRDSAKIGDGFYAGKEAGPIKQVRGLMPDSWAFSTKEQGMSCTKNYVIFGWTGIIPESCHNSTIIIPINYRWALWGWPNRLIARMEKVNTHIILMGPFERGKSNEGIYTQEHVDAIPLSYNGIIWVEDIATVGPLLRKRTRLPDETPPNKN